MIAYIAGVLEDAWDKSCLVVTASGIGYEIALTAPAFAELPPPGEQIAFYVSQIVREDSQELFGFASFDERQTFNVLTSVSKIGARSALAILSVFRPDELRQLVLEDNAHALTRVPGIGQKTAQHLLLELKYKLKGRGASKKSVLPGPFKPSAFNDALAALLNLGYREEECAAYIRAALDAEPDLDVGSLIRSVLKALAKGRSQDGA